MVLSSCADNSAGSLATEESKIAATPAGGTQCILWLLIATLIYQALLCFINTNVLTVTAVGVAFAEVLIGAGCIFYIIKSGCFEFRIACFAISTMLLLSLLRNVILQEPTNIEQMLSVPEIKAVRDLLIPILFYCLGKTAADSKFADGVLNVMLLLIFVFAFVELCIPYLYPVYFDISSYYASIKGAPPLWHRVEGFSPNSLRPPGIGRTLFPALGSHRISSILLEPISAGNFAIVVSAWACAKPFKEWRRMLLYLLSAVVIIVLSDSRYGLLVAGFLFAFRLLVPQPYLKFAFIGPLCCLIALQLTQFLLDRQTNDDLFGRLYASGKIILEFDTQTIFGLSPLSNNYPDSGYAYIFSRFGLPLAAAFWTALWILKPQSKQGEIFRALVAIHIALLCCISGSSLFALKSAGILWFLVGCSVAEKKQSYECAT